MLKTVGKAVRLGAMPRERRRIRVGRNRDNDVVVADKSVSSHQLHLLVMPDGRVLLNDCNSRNGTHIVRDKGQPVRIDQEWVSARDVVLMGNCRLSVRQLLRFANETRAVPARPPAGGHGSGKEPEPLAQGDDLVRCGCGAVKRGDAPCANCGGMETVS